MTTCKEYSVSFVYGCIRSMLKLSYVITLTETNIGTGMAHMAPAPALYSLHSPTIPTCQSVLINVRGTYRMTSIHNTLSLMNIVLIEPIHLLHCTHPSTPDPTGRNRPWVVIEVGNGYIVVTHVHFKKLLIHFYCQ